MQKGKCKNDCEPPIPEKPPLYNIIWIYENAADVLGSKRIVRNVFAQCKDMPCLLCYDEKKTSNDIDIKRGDMMDFPSRFFLFLLSTGVFFALALMIPLTSGMLLILPPLLALASTALVSHIFSQKKTHGRVGERSGRAERKNGKLETNRNF